MGSEMDDLGYAPIWPEMLGNTKLIDYLRESGYSAKSLDYFLIVARNSQQSRKTHDLIWQRRLVVPIGCWK
jgi:hypothetical protein